MTRLVARAGLAAALLAAAAAAAPAAARQPAALPKVTYWDRKNKQVVSGLPAKVEPSVAGYKLVGGGGTVLADGVSPADVLQFLPPELQPTAITQSDLEKSRDPAKYQAAIKGYEALRDKAADPRARAHAEYKIGVLTARLVEEAEPAAPGDKDRRAQALAAARVLARYVDKYPDTWEVWPAARTAARLSLAHGDPREAARVWAQAARKEARLPPDLALEAAFQEVDALIRDRSWTDALARLDALGSAPGAAGERAKLYRLAAQAGAGPNPAARVKEVEDELGKSRDPAVRATGYAMIGELYAAALKASKDAPPGAAEWERPRDVMWAYLWVEAVYNQDKDELAKAYIRLAEAFAQQGDADRAAGYRQKLRDLVAAPHPSEVK